MRRKVPVPVAFGMSWVMLTLLFVDVAGQAPECESTIEAVEVNGATLHYFECGEGDPLIFVHGSTGDLSWATAHAAALSSDLRAVSYSRRFHSPNDPPHDDDRYALQVHVADLASFLDELDFDPAHIVGHSYGAYVAVALAIEHPELVRSLVLAEPPIMPLLSRTSVGDALRESFRRRVLIPSRDAFMSGDDEEGLRRFYDIVISPGWFDELEPPVRQEIVEKAGPEFRLEMTTEPSLYMPPLACEALGEITAPTLLMTGEYSQPMFYLITAVLENCLDGASFVMIPDTGHVMSTNEAVFNDAVRSFVARN